MGRKISLGIAIIYLLVAVIWGGYKPFLLTLILLVIPLACIWFGEEMGGYIGGWHRIGRPWITKRSPGSLVSLFGWILLLAPSFILIIIKMIKQQ